GGRGPAVAAAVPARVRHRRSSGGVGAVLVPRRQVQVRDPAAPPGLIPADPGLPRPFPGVQVRAPSRPPLHGHARRLSLLSPVTADPAAAVASRGLHTDPLVTSPA